MAEHCPGGVTGRRGRFKSDCPRGRVGSTPTPGIGAIARLERALAVLGTNPSTKNTGYGRVSRSREYQFLASAQCRVRSVSTSAQSASIDVAGDLPALHSCRRAPRRHAARGPFAFKASAMGHKLGSAAGGGRGGLVTEHVAGRRHNGGDGVRALVRVRSEHDHDRRPRPFHLGCWTARRTGLARGGATLLASHAGTSPTGDERHSKRKSGRSGRQPQ